MSASFSRMQVARRRNAHKKDGPAFLNSLPASFASLGPALVEPEVSLRLQALIEEKAEEMHRLQAGVEAAALSAAREGLLRVEGELLVVAFANHPDMSLLAPREAVNESFGDLLAFDGDTVFVLQEDGERGLGLDRHEEGGGIGYEVMTWGI